MKESYDEGLANHIGPESCADSGNTIGEALTGESVGWVLSPVRDLNPSADALQVCRRQHLVDCYGKGYEGSAGSEAPCIHGNSLGGNREALYLTLVDCAEVRMENPQGVRPW
jgi:RNA-directed DNA polymerase